MFQELFSQLTEGSPALYPSVFVLLMLAGLCFPISADLVLLSCSALVFKKNIPWFPLFLVCAGGIFTGDLIMHAIGRKLGERHRWPAFLQRRLNEKTENKVRRKFEVLGAWAVFIARFIPGFRTVVIFFSGVLRVSFLHFVLADTLGLCIVIPTLLKSASFLKDKF